MSGETGAGKSLPVDALGFLSGKRADSAMVRHGAGRAELHAEFDLAASDAARQGLRAEEFDDGDACQLRRTLRAAGGSDRKSKRLNSSHLCASSMPSSA